MKVMVHKSGKTIELSFDSMPNLREFQNKIASNVFNTIWNRIRIVNIFFLNGDGEENPMHSVRIYHDDPAELSFDEFIRMQGFLDAKLDNVSVFAMPRITAPHNRPTGYTPSYLPGQCLTIPGKALTFFEQSCIDALQSDAGRTFEQEALSLSLSAAIIPEKFLDPITKVVMNDPVIASDLRVYDKSTLEQLNYVSPYSRQDLGRYTIPNLLLRSDFLDFVAEQKRQQAESIAARK